MNSLSTDQLREFINLTKQIKTTKKPVPVPRKKVVIVDDTKKPVPRKTVKLMVDEYEKISFHLLLSFKIIINQFLYQEQKNLLLYREQKSHS